MSDNEAVQALKDLLKELGEEGFIGEDDNGPYAYFDTTVSLKVLNKARSIAELPPLS